MGVNLLSPPEGPHLFPLEENHAEVMPIIDEAAREASELWAQAIDVYPVQVTHWAGYCKEMSLVMQQRLAVRGIGTRLQEYRLGPGAHWFLQTDEWPSNELDADPTWQQTLWRDRPDCALPSTLVVPVNSLKPALEAHHIPPEWHRTWLEARDNPAKWQDVPSRALQSLLLSLTAERTV